MIINVAILLLSSFLNLPLNDWFGLRVIYSSEFAPYQFLTYMWLHGGMWHLFGNMIAVLVFAPMLEMVWGSKRFLIFYLVCGIGAGVLYGVADAVEKLPLKNSAEAYIENPSPEAFEKFIIENKSFINVARGGELLDLYYENPAYESETVAAVKSIYNGVITRGTMVGASGAVFGILFAFAFLFPNTELFLLFPPIPIKAKYLVFFYGMYELYAEFNRTPGDNVAHLAHLSGMLIAFILLKFWKNDTRRFY
ncbi:rhomboid family intramembrane serine protease [Ekhidna sp. MALMAid0563]|uniref:rhomboid family intramembrane serine protease n=1 Tax=Ekhidna sp. MALMAid0563 TaxID=3143937 RepID=UPI0032DF3545